MIQPSNTKAPDSVVGGSKAFIDRSAGALIGAFIGDALALGPHWYYDRQALRRDYGDWIRDYADPLPHRYHGGHKRGELSQAGWLLKLTVRSLLAASGYDQEDFCRRMDEELFPLLDGTPGQGPGGYTSQSIREAWQRRVLQGKPWGEVAGHADTTEAIERTIAISVRYANEPRALVRHVAANAALTQIDDTVLAITAAFNAILGLMIEGHRLDTQVSDKLMHRIESGELPFHSTRNNAIESQCPGDAVYSHAGRFASPDAILTPRYMAEAASDPDIRIEPAWKVSLVYGMPCAIYHQVPAAYYLAARFHDDFESAVLHAVNGGGQNQSRAILTGALVGAQVGISGIPVRFIGGLADGEEILALATELTNPTIQTGHRGTLAGLPA